MLKIAILFATLSINHPEELAILRAWHANYGDAERITKLGDDCWKLCWGYNYQVQRFTGLTGHVFPWEGRMIAAMQFHTQVWNCVQHVFSENPVFSGVPGWDRERTIEDRIEAMKEIRELIGDHMYYSGCLPDIFPAGFPVIPTLPGDDDE